MKLPNGFYKTRDDWIWIEAHQDYELNNGDLFSKDHPCVIAPTLDELRVFALELIGPEPEKYKPTSEDLADIFPDITEEWDRYHANMNALKDALIKGCDPTASWILNTFGGK